MSHTPFILAAYATTAMVLLWAALSPVLQRRSFLRELNGANQHGDQQYSDTQHREPRL